MSTLLAIMILAATTFLLLGNLRGVAADTYQALAGATARTRDRGLLIPRLAFAALWLLIFVLGYF
ncbi:hypothetical protein AYJ57_06085 [Salipiger sp. CCB-MM3]|uniref:hypothetical protein n=1 Tax=Roseobacteraceae TaxID=2854170 RepID=UPI00080AA991|nr:MULTISPECIES: hypothetical protein [Roseobacteraceae]ANT59973.1 hypothetical protein AYJ57_06085 [Salipiger sp. CCB-MM3]MCA0997850.1 hypothetical protein [Alloyangia pacifica]